GALDAGRVRGRRPGTTHSGRREVTRPEQGAEIPARGDRTARREAATVPGAAGGATGGPAGRARAGPRRRAGCTASESDRGESHQERPPSAPPSSPDRIHIRPPLPADDSLP